MKRAADVFAGLLGIYVLICVFNYFKRTSDAPWILGRYDLPYFAFLCLLSLSLTYVVVVILVYRRRAWMVFAASALALGMAALMLEGGLQVCAWLHPAMDAMYLQPDSAVGWKGVPNLDFVWTGADWYASDFAVPVHLNGQGFHDCDHALQAVPGVKRVAVLGDSFVEAVQVPLDKTACRVLQSDFDRAGQRWEVLNFGVSSFGIGQYLLMWEKYAAAYHPDAVVVFVASFHMQRTVQKYHEGRLSGEKPLWVRPTFEVHGDELIRQPAQDYQAFVDVQQHLVARDFNGHRSRRRPWRLLTPLFLDKVKGQAFQHLEVVLHHPSLMPLPSADCVAVNLRILAELNREVQAQGARLIVMDASAYFDHVDGLSRQIADSCATHKIQYVPLYADLVTANQHGIRTAWTADQHFNEAGNRIFAEAMHQALTQP